MDSKGQAMPIASIILAGIVVVALLVIIANQASIGGGQGAVSLWCKNTFGTVVPYAQSVCAGLPFEAVGTISNPPVAPSGAGASTGLTPNYQVTTIAFKINPVEKYLAGTATGAITCNRRVGGAWLADINSNTDATLAVNQVSDLLCGDDDDSGTDYYKRWLPGVNSGIVSPFNPTYLFTREGSISNTITNSNGITENADTGAGSADINASQTYYFNIKSDNTTSYSCMGNEYTSKKMLVTVDANYNGEISKATPFGISATSGAAVAPSHSRDTNATQTMGFDVPALNLCNGASVSWKLKVEALSGMPTNLGAVPTDIQRMKVCFYDYTFQKNSDTGEVVETTFDPVDNSDIGITTSYCNYIYYH
jgi:hypothetical protein